MFRRRFTWIAICVAIALIGLKLKAQPFPEPAPAPAEYFAGNLGIYYTAVPYSTIGGGINPGTGGYDPNSPPGYGIQTYGARLTRYPVPGSPAAYLQLEPGDMVIALDTLAILAPNDVLAHRGQTSVVYINIRTGLPQTAFVFVP